MIHGESSEHPQPQEFGGSRFQPSWMTLRDSRLWRRKSLQTWWGRQGDEIETWSLEVGLSRCSLGRTCGGEEVLLVEQGKRFLEVEATPGEGAVKGVGITAKM